MSIRDAYASPCIIGHCTRSADHGRYCCWTCAEHVRAHLRDIDTYTSMLDAAPTRGGDTGRRSPGFGSRAPARLDVLAALDPRSLPHALGPDDIDHDTRSLPASLGHLAAWVAEECGDVRPNHRPSIASDARYLLGRIDWCTGQQWVDELAADIAELHAQCRRLVGDAPPKPVAPCPDCTGPLWPSGERDLLSVRCGNCGTTYDGLDLMSIAARKAPA